MPHCVQALRLGGGAKKGLADLEYVKSVLACRHSRVLMSMVLQADHGWVRRCGDLAISDCLSQSTRQPSEDSQIT